MIALTHKAGKPVIGKGKMDKISLVMSNENIFKLYFKGEQVEMEKEQKTKLVWVAIENIEEIKEKVVFSIIGVFSSQERAIKACTKRTHGYGPLRINEILPEKNMNWPWFAYPNIPDSEVIKQPQKCTCADGQGGPCSYCLEKRFNL